MAATVTHEKVGKTDQGLWKHKGWSLPAYIEHVANDLKAKTADTSAAVRLAIGIVRNWSQGHDGKGGKVSAATQAKAVKAIAEWEALKAKAKGSRLKEAAALTDAELAAIPEVTEDDILAMADRAAGRLVLLEARTLPTSGDGAQFDLALVEAASTVRRNGRQRGATQRARRETRGSDPQFDQAHPRARKGSRTGGEFIQSGDSGALVQGIQESVQAKADGKFGDKTKQAVMAYQKRHGLKVDGIVGAQTAAALRGQKDAAKVKVGALSARDRQFLGNHGTAAATRYGRRHRLREAVAIPSVLERVQQLHPGEHAMLPDGHAVRHVHTEDGRGVYQSGSPDRYAPRGGVSWHGDVHATPEAATAAAMTNSAAHDDPASVGGATRFRTYNDFVVGGQRMNFAGANAQGQPLVRKPGERDTRTSSWGSLIPHERTRLLEAAGFTEDLHPRDRRGKFRKGMRVVAKSNFSVDAPHGHNGSGQRILRGRDVGTVKSEDSTHVTIHAPGSPLLHGTRVEKKYLAPHPDEAKPKGDSGAKSLDSFKVDGPGTITHQGKVGGDGQAVRLRKDPSTGAWLVEKEDGSGRWLPNRFLASDAGLKAAKSHFLALVTGGTKAGAREQGKRAGL